MKYILLLPCGLCLELTKAQASKVLRFGDDTFESEDYGEASNEQIIFADGDRWVFEIDIFDETHPLD